MNDPWRQCTKRTNHTDLDKSKRRRMNHLSHQGLGLKHLLFNLSTFYLTKKLNSLSFVFSMHTSQNTLTNQILRSFYNICSLHRHCPFPERRGWDRRVPVSGNPDSRGSAHMIATFMAYLLLTMAALWWKCERGLATGNTCRRLIHVIIFRMITTQSYTDFHCLLGVQHVRHHLCQENCSESNVVGEWVSFTCTYISSGLMNLYTF